MSSSQIRAGQAYVELTLKDASLRSGLLAAQAKFKAFGAATMATGGAMIASGSAVIGSLLGTVNAAVEMGSAMADMSARTGVSVEALSELTYAASQCDVEAEALQGSLFKMQKAVAEAGDGSDSATEKFTDLGLSVAELQKLEPEGQFQAIASKIAAIQDPAEKTAAAMSVFGKSGANLLPLLNEGGDGIDALRQRANELGLTMSGEDAAAAESFGDALDTLWGVVKMGVFNIGSALIPDLAELVSWMTSAAARAGAWLKENRGLFASIMKIAAGVVAFGAGLVAAGATLSLIGAAFGGVVSLASAVSFGIGALGAVIAACMSPVVLLSAAVVALGGYFAVQSGVIGKATGYLQNAFSVLKTDALLAFDGIKSALAGGDFALAGKILWTTLKIEFSRGTGELRSQWFDLMETTRSAWVDYVFDLASIWNRGQALIKSSTNDLTTYLKSEWRDAYSALAKWMYPIFAYNGMGGFSQSFDEYSKSIDDAETQSIVKDRQDQARRGMEISNTKRDVENNLSQDRANRQRQISTDSSASRQRLEAELSQLVAERDRLVADAKAAAAQEVQRKIDGIKKGGSLPDDDENLKTQVRSVGATNSFAAGLIGARSGEIALLGDINESNQRGAKAAEQTAKLLLKLEGFGILAGND